MSQSETLPTDLSSEHDLIDLFVSSPKLRRCTRSLGHGDDGDAGTLLDSAPCPLEAAVVLGSTPEPRPDAVRLDQVLVTIEDSDADDVEDCLRELDNYLKEFDSSFGDGSVDSVSLNGAFFGNPIFRTKSDIDVRRVKAVFQRGHPRRSTVGHGLVRAATKDAAAPSEDVEDDADEDIDWSWLKEFARDEDGADNQAGEAPASGAVERAPAPAAVAQSVDDDGLMEERAGSSWLRASMRRVQHIRMPSDPQVARPVSAPSQAARSRPRSRGSSPERARSSSASSRSRRRRRRSLTSSESSLATSVDSTPSCTPAPTPARPQSAPAEAAATAATAAAAASRPCERPRRDTAMAGESNSSPPQLPATSSSPSSNPLGVWPHSLSAMLAGLGCTIGLFNVSRFAILSIHFGANFIIQFFILSLIIGIPLYTLHVCLGQQLGAGVIDMWRISPLFQGVGVALLAANALLGLYSIMGVSWMFIYFRDSFITRMDRYRWGEPFDVIREEKFFFNISHKLPDTVPDYFSSVVLQRSPGGSSSTVGTVKFQVAFNLAVVWMIVFVSLSKGLRSYGKVVYVFALVPVFATFVLCAKILSLTPGAALNEVFPETMWEEFFTNSKSWVVASQESFLTWGLLGAAAMQISSHNKHKHLLQRDSSLVIVLTFTILLLVAFLANTCVEILRFYGYTYLPASFESVSTYTFLRPNREPLPPNLASTPVRYMQHFSLVLGEKIIRPGTDPNMESGYQVLRLATELVPATFAALGADAVSPFWAVLFYFILIMFGIAQQLAIWHCVITGIMAIKASALKAWETTITFFSCTFGFLVGLPMTTEKGIFVVYFLDYAVGGAWWMLLVVLILVVAVFVVRGRPYSGDTLVMALFGSSVTSCLSAWIATTLSFTWNVILPVTITVMCISQFKSGGFRQLFVWHRSAFYEYWPLWARQIGATLQLIPILGIPVVAVIQSYRFLNNGPPDILDDDADSVINYRIQLLYRPPLDSEHMTDIGQPIATTNASAQVTIPAEDPPPKYTPPPSYTTATGARLAKLFRQSFRRSVRRIASVLGEGSSANGRQRGAGPGPQTVLPPPDYSTVLVEMNRPLAISITDSSMCAHQDNSQRISSFGRRIAQANFTSPLTAADVASLLRSSFRRSLIRPSRRSAAATAAAAAAGVASSAPASAAEANPSSSLSVECLVDGAAPLGETSLIMDAVPQHDDAGDADAKQKDNYISSTVIA